MTGLRPTGPVPADRVNQFVKIEVVRRWLGRML